MNHEEVIAQNHSLIQRNFGLLQKKLDSFKNPVQSVTLSKPPKNLTIYLIRHGSTELNEEDKLRSWMDVPLSSKGKKQAQEAAQLLKGIKLDAVYSSDLKRAVATAEEIAKIADGKVNKTSNLKPINFGELNGKPMKEIQPKIDKLMEQWKQNPDYKEFGSESFTDFQNRNLIFLNEIFQSEASTIAIAAHLRNCIYLMALVINGLKPLKGESLELMNRVNQDPGTISILENTDYKDIFQLKASNLLNGKQ